MSNNHPTPFRRQRGFMLVEVSIAVIILMVVTMAFISFAVNQMKLDAAKQTGIQVAQYNAAVSAFINGTQPNTPLGVFVGADWLKDAATCAGATGPARYLPCGFDAFLRFGLAWNTTIARDAAGFIMATTNLGPAMTTGIDRVAGGAIVNAASAFSGIASLNAEQVVGYTRYNIDPPTGNITAVIDTGVQNVPWLNRNGTNSMTGNLNMGGNNLNNARDVNANQDLNAGRNVVANVNNVGGDVINRNTRVYNPLTKAWVPVGLSSSAQVVGYVPNNGQVTKPACSTGNPKIYGLPAQMSNNGVAEPIGAIDMKATDSPTYWTVTYTIQTPTTGGRLAPKDNVGGAYANMLIMTACQ